MLYNVSYNKPEIQRKLRQEVGVPLSLKDRWKLRGSGSPKLNITSCSIHIHNLLVLDNNANICNALNLAQNCYSVPQVLSTDNF